MKILGLFFINLRAKKYTCLKKIIMTMFFIKIVLFANRHVYTKPSLFSNTKITVPCKKYVPSQKTSFSELLTFLVFTDNS